MKKRLGFLLTTGLLVPAISCSNQSINAQNSNAHTHTIDFSKLIKIKIKQNLLVKMTIKIIQSLLIQKLQETLIANQINIIFIRSLLVKFKIFFRHLKKQVIK